jgi:hypothetical protein
MKTNESVISREKPDAIFLQEVVPESLASLQEDLLDYEPYIGKSISSRMYYIFL